MIWFGLLLSHNNHCRLFNAKSCFTYIFCQSAGAIDCTSEEELDSLNECLGHDSKQSDGKVPVIPERWQCRALLHCHRSQVHSDPEWKHLIGLYLKG